MFSYKPLAETLKEKSISLKDVASEVNMSESILRSKMNNNEYITMKNLDQICNVLKVPVEKVIKWQKGEQNTSERFNVNWEFIGKKLEEKSMSLSELSIRCRLNKSTLFYAKKRNSQLMSDVIKSIAKILECNPDEIRLDAN